MSKQLIDGVAINELKVFKDERGAVMRMMRRDDPFFREFGEIYFSVVMPGVVKAWHLHKSMTLNYACVFGKIKLALCDQREGSPTCGVINDIVLAGYPEFKDYKLVTIPPGVWNGFRSLGANPSKMDAAIVANCSTEPHDPDEIVRLSPDDFMVPYDWGPYEVAG